MAQPQQSIKSILERNANVPFVKRILLPFKAPVAPDDEDPKSKRVMTHKMAWTEADGKYYVYPTVMADDKGSLQNYGDKAFDEAFRRRDYIAFATPEEADQFSKNYKTYWDEIGYKPELPK